MNDILIVPYPLVEEGQIEEENGYNFHPIEKRLSLYPAKRLKGRSLIAAIFSGGST